MTKITIDESYKISFKNSINSSRAPLLGRWENKETYDSLAKVIDLIREYNSPEGWAHIKTRGNISSKLRLTFLSIPNWGAHETNKWQEYNKGGISKDYLHMKIQPILKFKENKLEGKIKC